MRGELEREFEDRLRFIQEVVAPDDIYIFAELLMQHCMVLCYGMATFTNMRSVVNSNITLRKVLENVLDYNERFDQKDTTPLTIFKYDILDD